MKTILLTPKPKDQTACPLQQLFSVSEPCSISSNTRPKIIVRLTSLSSKRSSKPFFVRAWKNLGLLSIVSGRQLGETPSISKKKSWIGQLTWSTCRLCSKNSTPLPPQMRKFWFVTFVIAWDLLSKLKSMSEIETRIPEKKSSRRPLMLMPKQLVSLNHQWEK